MGWYDLESFPQGGQIKTGSQSVSVNLIGRREEHKVFGKDRQVNQEGCSQNSEAAKRCVWLLWILGGKGNLWLLVSLSGEGLS